MQSVTFSYTDICTLEGHPAPEISEYKDADGSHLVLDFQCENPVEAVKTAKAITRELVKYRVDRNVQGDRHGARITFTFGVEGAELPATWRGRSGSATVTGTKPALLTEIQEALKPYAKASYFNSSVNQGVVVENVPVGLQFEEKDGNLIAKLLLSKKGDWKEVTVTTDQAVELVARLQSLLSAL